MPRSTSTTPLPKSSAAFPRSKKGTSRPLSGARASRDTTNPADLSWLVAALPQDKLVGIGGSVTGLSKVFSADIVAVSQDGRAFKRVRIVIDGTNTPAKIIYRRDLTSAGWPLGEQAPRAAPRRRRPQCPAPRLRINISPQREETPHCEKHRKNSRHRPGPRRRPDRGSLQPQPPSCPKSPASQNSYTPRGYPSTSPKTSAAPWPRSSGKNFSRAATPPSASPPSGWSPAAKTSRPPAPPSPPSPSASRPKLNSPPNATSSSITPATPNPPPPPPSFSSPPPAPSSPTAPPSPNPPASNSAPSPPPAPPSPASRPIPPASSSRSPPPASNSSSSATARPPNSATSRSPTPPIPPPPSPAKSAAP